MNDFTVLNTVSLQKNPFESQNKRCIKFILDREINLVLFLFLFILLCCPKICPATTVKLARNLHFHSISAAM